MFSAGASYGSDGAISSTICQLATWPGVAQCLDEPNPEVGCGLPSVEGADEIAGEYVPAVGLADGLDQGGVEFISFARRSPGPGRHRRGLGKGQGRDGGGLNGSRTSGQAPAVERDRGQSD
jgi:hypothetical protein